MNTKIIFLLFIIFVLVIIVKNLQIYNKNKKLETFLENYSKLNSKLTENDEKFIDQCFSKNELKSFEKYYGYVNIDRYFLKNKQIGNIFYTDNNTILETPKLSDNGLFISHLCVDNKYRKQGIGTKMINKVINKAKQLNKDHVILLVKAHNKKAINLYEKLGFRKHQRGMLMGGIEAIYYVKYL